MKKKLTQNEVIKNHLKKFKRISTWEAIKKYHITRLGARIWDLRNIYGISIGSRKEKSYTVYFI